MVPLQLQLVHPLQLVLQMFSLPLLWGLGRLIRIHLHLVMECLGHYHSLVGGPGGDTQGTRHRAQGTRLVRLGGDPWNCNPSRQSSFELSPQANRQCGHIEQAHLGLGAGFAGVPVRARG